MTNPSPEAIALADKLRCDDCCCVGGLDDESINIIQAAFDARDVAKIPSGYVLVPIEPTKEMINAGIDAWNNSKFAIVTIYKAMINARPKVE